MKKNVLLVAALLFAGTTFAQTESDALTNDNGERILPEAGDYGLGFDASNFVNFFGNMFNGTQNNSINGLGFQRAQTIFGKYFVEDQKAYRAMVRLGTGTNSYRFVVPDFSSTNPNATVEDEYKVSGTNIAIGGGIENRRGNGRLQGVYGPVAMISYSSGADTTAIYGNTIEDEGSSFRIVEVNSGSIFGIELGGFVGAEYFFAPKVSVGAEIMWTLVFNSQANGETTIETWDGTETSEVTTETGGTSSFSIDTRPNGNISLNVYF